MLSKLYVDNFRCLDNFELDLDETNVFIGRNGTGKTSVLHVLRNIQNLIVRGSKVDEVSLSETFRFAANATNSDSKSKSTSTKKLTVIRSPCSTTALVAKCESGKKRLNTTATRSLNSRMVTRNYITMTTPKVLRIPSIGRSPGSAS